MDYTFLSDNYVWIIVVTVIIAMTIIGYMADKKNFGEKKEKTKKEKSKKVIPVQEVEEIEEPITEEIPMDNFMTEPTQQEEILDDTVNNDTDFEMPGESVQEVEKETGFEAFEPVASFSETPQDESMDFEMPMENEIESVEEFMPESSEETVSDVLEQPNDMPMEEKENQEDIISQESAEDFGLPSIDTLNQEIAEVEEDEDVWKF